MKHFVLSIAIFVVSMGLAYAQTAATKDSSRIPSGTAMPDPSGLPKAPKIPKEPDVTKIPKPPPETPTTGINPTQSSSLGPISVTPKSERTQFNTAGNPVTVAASGEIRCPPNTIMVGLGVNDPGTGAFRSLRGTRVNEECKAFGTALSFSADNTNYTLLIDPSKLTYTIICRPISLDFY